MKKAYSYSPSQDLISKVCRALGHPARVAIIEAIAKEKDCVNGRVVNVSPILYPTVLNHLKGLNKAGLIKGNVNSSKDLSYCVDWNILEEFKVLFDAMYEEIKENRLQVKLQNGKCTK